MQQSIEKIVYQFLVNNVVIIQSKNEVLIYLIQIVNQACAYDRQRWQIGGFQHALDFLAECRIDGLNGSYKIAQKNAQVVVIFIQR